MPLYEHVFLARQDISGQQVDGLTETYQGIITENGGSIAKTEYWGLKNLAYKIKKNRKAHITLMNIDAPHEAVAEMERQMRISSDVIRFLTVRVKEHDPNPSPIMKRGDRDDRRGGRRDHRDRDRDRGRGGPPRQSREAASSGESRPSGEAAADKKPSEAPAEKKPSEAPAEKKPSEAPEGGQEGKD